MDGNGVVNPGFYFNDNDTLIYGPNYVLNIEFELHKEQKDDYNYPVFGWHWFDSEDEAYAFFGIEKLTTEA